MKIGFIVARIITAIMLLFALDRHPYSYYTLLRLITCGVSVWGLVQAMEKEAKSWLWIFGISVFLFNPIFPVHLDKQTWAIVDVIVAGIFITSIFIFKSRKIFDVKKLKEVGDGVKN